MENKITQKINHYSALKRLSSEEIHSRTLAASRTEKDATLNLLYHLQVVRDRRVYALKGYDGIWKYCMRELGYSESGTSERIGAMQLLEALPEKVNAKTETLTQLTVMADEETMELLKRFQELKGQSSYNEVLKLTLQEYLKKKVTVQPV